MRLTAAARSGVTVLAAVLAAALVIPVPATAASAAGSTEQLQEYASAT
jgi:hypothetical protein